MSTPQQPPFGPPVPPKQGMSTGKKVALFGCATPLLVLFLMVGCVAVLAPGGEETAENTDTEAADADAEADGEEDNEQAHELGETFEHGSFEFTVHSIEEGVAGLEDEFGLTQEARGEYIVVELTAENTSSSAEYLEGSNQVLMDTDGNMYERDISASSDDSFMDQLNPGQAAEATLAYDVTPGTEIDHMLVNGKTMVDDGVRVDLG
ncbi:DUF4352 domain-containing protein [Nocardiopsis kunsanensis]|nr:DUF4352 domain-containing protein [Nocardiopsis kunsanensis]